MTPAVNCLKQAKINFQTHTYDHDPEANAWGEEAAVKLNVPFDRIFKTLVTRTDKGTLAVGVVPVSGQMDLKALAKALKVKKIIMADKMQVERTTGYVLGGVSPLGQKKKLPTVIDASALEFDTVYVSAGRRGLQLELAPKDLAALTMAGFNPISR